MKRLLQLILSTVSFYFTCPIFSQELSERIFDFEPDVRIFTAHAFMNAAGNDAEWRKEGMHPFRLEVRRYLHDILDSAFVERLKQYSHTTNKMGWSGWAPYGLLTAGPPNFQLKYDSASTDESKETEVAFPNLSPLLAEFFEKAKISDAWKSFQPRLQVGNNRYKSFTQKALDDIVSYCQLEADYFQDQASKMHVQFSPLMLYYTSQTVKVNGEIWFIFGPQDSDPSPSSFYHEALHYVIDPLVAANREQVELLKGLVGLPKGGSTQYEIVNESFVRTIDKILAGRLYGSSAESVRQKVNDEYKLGYVLCLTIFQSLSEYEKSNLPLIEYFSKVIVEIDVQKEKQRWMSFQEQKSE